MTSTHRAAIGIGILVIVLVAITTVASYYTSKSRTAPTKQAESDPHTRLADFKALIIKNVTLAASADTTRPKKDETLGIIAADLQHYVENDNRLTMELTLWLEDMGKDETKEAKIYKQAHQFLLILVKRKYNREHKKQEPKKDPPKKG